MAVVDSLKRSAIVIVDKQIYAGIWRNIVLGLRKRDLRGCLPPGAGATGQQNADFAHCRAIARRPAGAGIIAGDFPIFVGERETARRGGHQRGRTEPQYGGPEKWTHRNPYHRKCQGIICALRGFGNPNYVSAPPIRQRAKRRISSARRWAVSTSAWLRLISMRLRQPSTINSICLATISGSSTSS